VNSQNFISAGPVEKVTCDTQLGILSLYLKILHDFFFKLPEKSDVAPLLYPYSFSITDSVKESTPTNCIKVG